MGAIPQKKRVVYRRDISIACAIASTLAGVFLLVARNHLMPETIMLPEDETEKLGKIS